MTRYRMGCGVALLLAVTGCGRPPQEPVAAPPPPPPPPVVEAAPPLPEPPAEPPAGIPNFAVVEPGIYRGGAPTAEGLKSLQDMGVRTIIDLRIEKARKQEEQAAKGLGFEWIGLPMGREAPTKSQVETFLTTLTDAAAKPVFVHCQHGADRTGCMVGLYRVQTQGWTFEKAWPEMRKYGFKPWLEELKNSVRDAKPAVLSGA